MKKISVIGSGSWGSALANVLADNGYSVLMWGHDKNQIDEINDFHTNTAYLGEEKLVDTIVATNSLEEVVNYADDILMVIPTKFFRNTLHKINELITKPKIFINASKGMEPGTFKSISQLIEEEIDDELIKGIAILTGPSHAEEVIVRQLTTIASVSKDEQVAKHVQEMFSNEYLRIYTHTDLIGAEVGSSLKNVIAIASGIIYGLGFGDNTRAALITRGLAEMIRYGKYKGADESTFYGLTGIGDLIVTATSFHSRNFQAGKRVGEGEDPRIAVEKSTMVVEGVRTAKAIYEETKELPFDMPIVEAVYKIFYEGKNTKDILKELINRELKPEKE